MELWNYGRISETTRTLPRAEQTELDSLDNKGDPDGQSGRALEILCGDDRKFEKMLHILFSLCLYLNDVSISLHHKKM